ncbi:ribulose-phosphate 3-epimerase [Candidatus Aerophobetes bacterium]|nr:ribulose-phosphate 3-epimerase [Candidatus Aerophobetes bacterium]
MRIAPSILSADFSCLLDEIKKVEKNADLLHIDIMDGHFVPNISFGAGVLKSLKGKIKLPFDVHLMVRNPERWIEVFAEVGCEFISFHQEAAVHLDRVVNLIKKRGIKCGVALNPATPEVMLNYILSKLDLVVVMAVNPGFGGQEFIPGVLPKIRNMRKIAERENINLDIAVDGGINEVTAKKVVAEGANILIMGSFIFRHPDPGKLITELKNEFNERRAM